MRSRPEGLCRYPIVDRGGRARPCSAPAEPSVRLTRAASGTDLAAIGRRTIDGAPYCAQHGGRERADAEARSDWSYLAPDAVGDDAAVHLAGEAHLTTDAAYLVVRRRIEETAPALWRVRTGRLPADEYRLLMRIGLGVPRLSVFRAEIEDAAARLRERGHEAIVDELPARSLEHGRPWYAEIGVGSLLSHVGVYATREAAIAEGTHVWRDRLAARVEAIRAARGDTLSWGLPVVPLADPILLEPRAGESGWDVAVRTPRVAEEGVSAILGLRASGEAA